MALLSLQRLIFASLTDNARFLAGQLSDLDRRQGLEDAKRRLREQTADLLQASKDALKDKDSDDAKNRLNNIVSSMKGQVRDLAEMEEAKRRRQQELLKTAGGIGLAMQQMEQAAGGAELADRPAKNKGKICDYFPLVVCWPIHLLNLVFS